MPQKELAEAAGVSVEALSKYETNLVVPHESTIEKLRSALERRGIVFTNGDEPGVKLVPGNATIPT
jgi:transcriptional regulator with XRE-family HTH domain